MPPPILPRRSSRSRLRRAATGRRSSLRPKPETLPAEQVPLQAAKFAGLQDWAAVRGIAPAKSQQCLTNKAEVDKLVAMTGNATNDFPDFPGTPTFVLNGKMVDLGPVTAA